MATAPPLEPPHADVTVDDVVALFGPIPLWRLRTDPRPGTATEEDMIRIRDREDRTCELVDGILVEKAVSGESSLIGLEIGRILGNFIHPLKLGFALGSDGMLRLTGRRLRAADVSFIHRQQVPGGRFPTTPIPDLYPTLAVEVLSPSNTRREMEVKRADYFAAGTRLVWVVDPARRTVEVFTGPESSKTLTDADTLDGGDVLPGFSVPVAEIFAATDLGGGDEKSPQT